MPGAESSDEPVTGQPRSGRVRVPWQWEAGARPRRTRVVFQEPGGGRRSGRAATVEQVLAGQVRPVSYRRRAMAALGTAVVLLGGSALAGSASLHLQQDGEPGTGPVAVDAQDWTQQAQVTLTAVSRQLDQIAQAEAAWHNRFGGHSGPPPAELAELQAAKAQLELTRTVLEDQLAAVQSVPEVESELAELERHVADVEQTISALPSAAGTPEPEESVSSLSGQRELWADRLDAKRAELERLQEDVHSAVSSPLPAVTDTVEQTVDSVLALADPSRPAQPTEPDPVTPSTTAPRADDQRRPRDEVGVGAPPDPLGLLGDDPDAGRSGSPGGPAGPVGGAVEGAGGAVDGVAGTAESVLTPDQSGQPGRDSGHAGSQDDEGGGGVTGQPAVGVSGGQPDSGVRGVESSATRGTGSPVPGAAAVPSQDVRPALHVADSVGVGELVRPAVYSGPEQSPARPADTPASAPSEDTSDVETERSEAAAATASAVLSGLADGGSTGDGAVRRGLRPGRRVRRSVGPDGRRVLR